MLRLSRMADYGIVLLVQFVQDESGSARSAAELAEATGISVPTVSKCLKVLAKAGILESQRGVKGGYLLARPATKVSLAEAIRALDGPISLTVCCQRDEDAECKCELQEGCIVKVNWRKINSALEQALASVPLSEMANPNSEVVPSPSGNPLSRRASEVRL